MLKNRVIPSLLLKNGGLVKTVKFKSPTYVGDPINAIRIFNEKEVDELMVLDISASIEQKDPDYSLIEQFASECFMPLTYGGGIKTIEQASTLFSLGIEKICVQSAALENPSFISRLAEKFGQQSIMVSIDIKKNWHGSFYLYTATKRKMGNRNWLEELESLVKAGAGEVILNSVDRDGTLAGPDLKNIAIASSLVDVPLIAVGGIGSLNDIKLAVSAGASAVAAGSFFIYHGPHRAVLITYPKYQELELLFKGA
jgi:cyclase